MSQRTGIEWTEVTWNPVTGCFLLRKCDQAMTRLGYPSTPPAESHSIRVEGKNAFLYSLVFYSKDPLGQKLWKAARKAINLQYGFEL